MYMRKPAFRLNHRLAYEHPVLLVNGGNLTAGALMHVSARFGAGLRLEAVPAREAWDYLLAEGRYTRRDVSLVPLLIVFFPGKDGGHLELLAKIRARPALKHAPFVLLTDDGKPCADTDGRKLGPILYWKRPDSTADYDSLTARIISLLA